MSKTKRIGIIAEDNSDFDTLVEVIPKIKKNEYVFRPAFGKGCGKIKSRCLQYSKVLSDKGCEFLIVLIDADNKCAKKLKKDIEKALCKSSLEKRTVVVAVQELEAWLLCDRIAIHKTYSNSNTPAFRAIASPEKLRDPKTHLRRLVKQKYKRTYLNTTDNKKIAAKIDIKEIKEKCSSFANLNNFIKDL